MKIFLHTVAAVLLVSFSSCQKRTSDQAWWQAESERISLEKQLELRKFQFEARMPVVTDEDLIAVDSSGLAESLRLLSLRKADLAIEVSRSAAELEEYKSTVIREFRQSMVGRKWDELRTAKGRVYHEVIVASVDDAGVSIRHQDGSARLVFDDLDREQREMFAMDGVLAMEALRDERQKAAAYREWIDRELSLASERAQNKPMPSGRTESASSANLLASNTLPRRPSPLAEPPRRFGNGSWRDHANVSYRTRRYRDRPTYYHVYYIRRPSNVATYHPHPSQPVSIPVIPSQPAPSCP